MRVRSLIRLTPSAGAVGLAAFLVLAPLPAWTEELGPEATLPPQVDQPAAADVALLPSPPAAPATPSTWAVDRTTPDNPWAHDLHLASEELCDPWNGATRCTEAVEVLSDPWPTDPQAVAAPAAASPPPQAEEADLRLMLRGEGIELLVDVEWAQTSASASCVPAEAEVRVHGRARNRALSGSKAGKISPLETWVIDLGAPLEPFD